MTQTTDILAPLRSRGDRGHYPDGRARGSRYLPPRSSHPRPRAEGYNITVTPQMTPTGKTVARYRLIEPKPYEQTELAL